MTPSQLDDDISHGKSGIVFTKGSYKSYYLSNMKIV